MATYQFYINCEIILLLCERNFFGNDMNLHNWVCTFINFIYSMWIVIAEDGLMDKLKLLTKIIAPTV